MRLKKIIIRMPITILFIVISVSGCQSQNINFNFYGRKVLYSDEFEGRRILKLLNLDTKEELKFDNFNEIGPVGFLLFNNGKNIFVDSYDVGSSGGVLIYDILNDKKIEIDIHEKNDEMAGFKSANIYDSNFYFASVNKIFAHSLYDFELTKEYTVDSLIYDFAVYNNDIIAIVFNIYDYEHNGYRPSNIYLYNFKNKIRTEIPYLSGLDGWSKDRKKLLFNSRGPKILEYPSLIVKSIDTIDKDSLKIYGQMNFVGNDEIIFTGFKKGGNHFEETNLYILNLETEKIEQITNTNTPKEIKSTDY